MQVNYPICNGTVFACIQSCSEFLLDGLPVSCSFFVQLLTDDDFQRLRVEQAYANLQPKRAKSKDVKMLAAIEEERFVKSWYKHGMRSYQDSVRTYIHVWLY